MKRSKEEIKRAVKDHYGSAISRPGGSCCGPSASSGDAAGEYIKLAGYSTNELGELPENITSFGCGNPVSFIDVKEGEVVLDLGSGAGLDLILAARKVGPQGKVIGLDMTPEMIETCRRNLKAAGIENGEVRMGEMEQMPVADSEVDWIISNCVINLSPDKPQVFAEAFRVLKPGGRLLVSDIVTLGLPEAYRDDLMAWVGCISGAVDEQEYIGLAERAGFVDVKVVDKMVYTAKSLDVVANDACGCGTDEREKIDPGIIRDYADKIASIKLSARKPS